MTADDSLYDDKYDYEWIDLDECDESPDEGLEEVRKHKECA